MLRRAAVVAAAIATTAGVGLAGVGTASAVPTSPHIKSGAQWTAELNPAGCEVDTFAANHTFSGDQYGDKGTWTGGGKAITMTWTAGFVTGLTFTGTFTERPTREYVGNFGGVTAQSGQLVKGVSTFHGATC